MFVLYIAVFLGSIFLILYRKKKNMDYWQKLANIPGDATIPIWGHAHKFGDTCEEIYVNLMEMWRRHDKRTFRMEIGQSASVMISTPENIKAILTINPPLFKHLDYKIFSTFTGNGLLTSDGDLWAQQRKIITPTFHFAILERYLQTFNQVSAKLVGKMEDLASGETIEVHNIIDRFTLDVICQTAMGFDFKALDSEIVEYCQASREVSSIVNRRIFNAFKRIDIIFWFTFDFWRQCRRLNSMKALAKQIIQKRKVELKPQIDGVMNGTLLLDDIVKDKRKRLTFLDLLLFTKTLDGKAISNKLLLDEVSTFLIGGNETTASTISFMLLCISRYPDIQKKLYDEIINEVGPNKTVDISMSQLQELRYMERVCKETLRYYPSVPLFGRYAHKEILLPDGTIVPKGASIYVLGMCMYRNDRLYPDPWKFDPDRFLPERHLDPFAFVPFSAGARNCIGQKYAYNLMKVAVAKILLNFELMPVANFEPILTAENITKSSNGIKIAMRKRT